MDRKSHFFLICVCMSNTLFTMENSGELSCFANACQQIKSAFEQDDITLLAKPLDFFSDLQEGSIESVEAEMYNFVSPLLYSIKKIASINAEIVNLISMHQPAVDALPTPSEIAGHYNLVKKKNEHFQVLKMLCISFPIFFSNKWNCEVTTPLLYACSCATEMKEEVSLMLTYNADPCQEVIGEDVRHKIALEAANFFGHQSSVDELIKFGKKQIDNEDNKEVVTRNFFTTGLTKKQLEKKHKKLISTIEDSNYEEFNKRVDKDYIDINYIHQDQQNGPLCLLAIALNNYFLQRELFKKIVLIADGALSKRLQIKLANASSAAQGILFGIIDRKANLDIDYIYSPITEDIRDQHFSTPLKEAINYNARALIVKLIQSNADIYYRGDLDDLQPTALEFAGQKSIEMFNFIVTLLSPSSESTQLNDDIDF